MMGRQGGFLFLLSVLTASNCAVLTTKDVLKDDTTLTNLQTTTEIPPTSKHLHKTDPMSLEVATMTSQSLTSPEATSPSLDVKEDAPCNGLFEQQNFNADVTENMDYSHIPLSPPLTLCHPELNERVTVQVNTIGFQKDKFWVTPVNATTYQLHMKGTLDYEQYQRIDLFLKANSGVAVVTIRVIGKNDNVPVLAIGQWKNVTIPENSAIGTMVAILHATDADKGPGGTLTYHIDADNSDECPAKVDSTSGYLTLIDALDYEKKKTYTCLVYATDTKDLHSSNHEVITINVKDVNDNTPLCTEPMNQFVMSWPLHHGDYVGKVTAYDRDSNQNGEVRYSIESPFDAIVGINATTGIITVIDEGAYQFSAARNVTFMATAKDGGQPPRQGQCQVMITLIQDYKRWFYDHQSYIFTVREDAKPDDEVGEVSVSSTDVIHYIIKTTESLPFKISDNGIITLEALLDYERKQNYFFVVEAHDKYAHVSVNVTINVVDVNDNRPNFTEPSGNKFVVYISRLAAGETVVFSVKAVDKDSGNNGAVSYYIKSNMDGALFGIEKSSGKIRLRHSAANIVKQELHITVEATDNGPVKFTRYKEIDFIIQNYTFNEYYYTNVTEYPSHSRGAHGSGTHSGISNSGGTIDVNPDQLLGIFKNISKDVSVDIVSGNEDNQFALSTTHELKTAKPLDYEVKPYHELTMKVSGKTSNMLVGYIHVAIEVIDLNDNVPMFISPGSLNFDIPTTAKANSPIYQFVAHDKDSPLYGDDVLTYTLKSGNDIVDLDPKTGRVTLKRAVTIADKPITVEASVNDTVNEARAVKVTFNVYDPISDAPVFEKLAYFGSVHENKPPNSEVMHAIPSLPYIPQTAHDVTMDIVGTGMPFYATPQFGEVHTNATLDREAQSKYAIAIKSMSNHLKTMSTTVFGLIDVTDENDNAPKFPFSVRQFTVHKSDPEFVEVAKIKAFDKDSISHLTYYKDNDVNNCFFVNATDNVASIRIANLGTINSTTLTMQLHVHDELPSHNDTMKIVVTVL